MNIKLFGALLAGPIRSGPFKSRTLDSDGAMRADGFGMSLLTSTACFLPLSANAIRR